jgi:bacillithiol biosynthesis deacetylase BshB1
MQLDLLAFGAHPDDVELCCGGTLIKHIKHGYTAGIIDLTDGELGTRGTKEIRAREAKAAARIIGCVRESCSIPDGNIELNDRNLKKVITILRKYRPRVIFIPHFQERHPDHVHAHHLCREAWFYAGLRKIKTTLNGKPQDPWRPQNYYTFMQWLEFTPSFIVDITDEYEQRLASIKAHASQFYDPTSKDPQTILSQQSFLAFLESRARTFGWRIGTAFGEPFYSVETPGVNDILKLQMFKG